MRLAAPVPATAPLRLELLANQRTRWPEEMVLVSLITDQRALAVVPYQEPISKGDNPEFSSTLSSTMPMAAMFTRNKFVGWAGVVFSIQNWLGESAETKKNGTPGYFNVGLSVMALAVTYMPLFMPPPDRSAAGTATGAPAPVPPA
ncbi:Uncharacterized protein HC256_008004 [Beauveria bassiana]|nr:Uncharacterized protein HC256_008004 [Beauveria bassiana]